MSDSLVRSLPAGSLDIIADVHGEIDALTQLLKYLGYDGGVHPQGRSLVLVGDLVDRGPDSLGVVAIVRQLVAQGACCVMGNHELNILRGKTNRDNAWYHALPESQQQSLAEFFHSLPLALEREDVRVAHAHWDHSAIHLARAETNALECFRRYEKAIRDGVRIWQESVWAGRDADWLKVERSLFEQNYNPVKLLTSGPERRAVVPFHANNELRHTERFTWWDGYTGPLCVVGHYWRAQGSKPTENHLFDDAKPYHLLGRGDVMCIDYSVGWRFKERQTPGFNGEHRFKLTALRWPEMQLMFDDGNSVPIAGQRSGQK